MSYLRFMALYGTNRGNVYGYFRKIESAANAPPGALIRK